MLCVHMGHSVNSMEMEKRGNPPGVINMAYTRDHFAPHLRRQLQQINTHAIAILDSASAHISPLVLSALEGLRYAVIPGGLAMFVKNIDTALTALYRSAHHRLYLS